jgi:hypothetical protein
MFERYQDESRRTLFLARETALGEQREMIEQHHPPRGQGSEVRLRVY